MPWRYYRIAAWTKPLKPSCMMIMPVSMMIILPIMSVAQHAHSLTSKRPYVLGPAQLAILDALLQLYFLTSWQVTRLLYSLGSATTVRMHLKNLVDHGYCDVVYLGHHAGAGRAPLVFTLTRKGLNALAEAGREIPVRFRPSEKQQSDYTLRHTLALNDALISLQLLARQHPAVQVARLVHERDLNRRPTRVILPDGSALGYAADGWVELHVTREGGRFRMPLLLELDRATEHITKWRRKVAAILAFVQEPYREIFRTSSVTVIVIAAPSDGASAEKRRAELARWTEAELTARGEQARADLFRFAAFQPETDPAVLFLSPRWYRPFDPTPTALIEGVSP